MKGVAYIPAGVLDEDAVLVASDSFATAFTYGQVQYFTWTFNLLKSHVLLFHLDIFLLAGFPPLHMKCQLRLGPTVSAQATTETVVVLLRRAVLFRTLVGGTGSISLGVHLLHLAVNCQLLLFGHVIVY